MKKSFILHLDSLVILDKMTDQQAGQFLKILYNYQKNNTIPELDFAMEMAITPFLNQFSRDEEKYLSICDRNKTNIEKRWNTKNTTGTSGIPKIPMDTKNTDNDSDNDNDNDSDNDNKSDNDNESKNENKNEIIFNKFREIYPGNKRGNKTEFDNFCKKHKDWKEVLLNLKDSLKNQIAKKQIARQNKLFVPEWANLQTWINQRRWEEEININIEQKQPKKIIDNRIVGNPLFKDGFSC
jgi:hypothetical protein